MKTRRFVSILILVLVVLTVFGSYATERKRISEKEFWNVISGVWLNTNYLGNTPFYEQKLIIHTDGKFGYYPLTTNTDPIREIYPFNFTQAWIDSEGVVWFKGTFREPYTIYTLSRITDSGNTLEIIGDSINNPTEWDTSKVRYENYEIRYRQ